jgi:hypothetical protein
MPHWPRSRRGGHRHGKDRRVVVDFGAIGTKTVFAKLLEHDAATSAGLN